MASRNLIQQQHNRGEAEVPGAMKQKNIAAGAGERKNRRALGEIGNLVTVRGVDGKPLPNVGRPVTRSFCAQLLANAQAEKNKNTLAAAANVKVPEGKKAVRVPKKAPAVVVVKPKPEEVIEISPDSSPEEKKVQQKKAPTLTSTLTARSKAACGLRNRPKEQIVDIDAADVDNDLAVVEYIEDMYTFYKSAENENRPHDYMDMQPEINEKMRAILIDWLVQIHHKFELSPETLYLTINIVDRYLALKVTPRRELQLVGMSAMLIASKYEEIWAPEVNDLVCISDKTYTNHQVLVMEKKILGQLEWYLTVPTPYVFLVRFIKASMTDSAVENMVFFLAELGMMNYETIIYCPSMIAASAVYAARCALMKTPVWNETLKVHTGFSEQQLMDCAKLLAKFHSMAGAADQKLKGIYRKYSSSERQAVALIAPAKSLLGCLVKTGVRNGVEHRETKSFCL